MALHLCAGEKDVKCNVKYCICNSKAHNFSKAYDVKIKSRNVCQVCFTTLAKKT